MKRFWPLIVLLLPVFGHAFMSEDYYQAGSNEFYCASTTTAPGASPAGLTAASPPLILQNPMGSNVRLVLKDEGVVLASTPTVFSDFLLAYNVVPSSAVASPVNGAWTSAQVGISTSPATTTSKAGCYVAGQLPASPVAFRAIGWTSAGASADGGIWVDRSYPDIVVPPGGILSIQTTGSVNPIAHISWVEVPY